MKLILIAATAVLFSACSPSAQKFMAADWQGARYNEMKVDYFFEEDPRGHALYIRDGKNFLFYEVDLEEAIRMAKTDLMARKCGSRSPVVIEDIPSSPHKTVFSCA